MRRLRGWRARARDDRGSAAIETVIGIPAFMLFVGLIIFAGRTAVAHQAVEQAAYDAARAASITRTTATADDAARQAASDTLANQGLHCATTNITVDTNALAVEVGSFGTVTVEVACLVDLSDLAVPGVPGTHLVSAEVASPVDAHRERG
ncbi:TadE/TadG family type IV pilus assembly protein [Georgenia subflava]|uniref:Pilus assembly protein n=1 Tax=Georgenia subflava TaxID=1622177 RepID=A0A6N7EGY4_9MICO|nr:TadE/TadG family type IV pilus assembly protein [Georgenia subflava]MPV35957.1 pilus assembly protein [Georgenia subflava]